MRHPIHVIRSVLGWLALGVVGTSALLIMLVIPDTERRRRIGRFTSRTVLLAAGIRLVVRSAVGADAGKSHQLGRKQAAEDTLPRGCVVVANHTSYLDGLILTAALPPHFVFVIKKEMSRVPLAGLLLRRLGSEFVDRFDRHRGAMDARRVLRRAREGQALVFFPEGTFSKQPGLLRFHSGAFVAAVRAGCPVVPIVIYGAREVLPYNRLISKPGVVSVEILEALTADPKDAKAATHLRDEARRRILERLGEPDLALAIAPAQGSPAPVSQVDPNALQCPPSPHLDL